MNGKKKERKANETAIRSRSLRPVVIPVRWKKKKESPRVNMMNDRTLVPNIILRSAARRGGVCRLEALNRKTAACMYINTVPMDLRSVRGSGVADKSPRLYSSRIKSVDKAPLAKSNRGKSAKSRLACYARLRVRHVLMEDLHNFVASAFLQCTNYVSIRIRWAMISFITLNLL